jgi:hypothetical protein
MPAIHHNNTKTKRKNQRPRCKSNHRRCRITGKCVTTNISRLANAKRCRRGTQKCANRRCYSNSKTPKYQFELLDKQLDKRNYTYDHKK